MNTQGQTEDEVSPKTLLLYWTGPFFFFNRVSFRIVGDARLGFLWKNYSNDLR